MKIENFSKNAWNASQSSLVRLGDSFYVFPNTTNNTLSHKKENENISVNANLVFFRKRKPKALCGLSEQKLGWFQNFYSFQIHFKCYSSTKAR